MEGLTRNNRTEVSEADRIKTIAMLYDGAANFTRVARKKLETGDTTGKSLYLGKTSAIVSELSRSLNMEGGDVSRNLKKLYDFMLSSLHKADVKNDIKAIEDVEKVIEILRSAWKEMQDTKRS
ncbi:MAG: flagellar export chaperone FliS [Nitrospirae bacterium]|nr:flagellar export chaperone FliS [Nitrospirota bacterium]